MTSRSRTAAPPRVWQRMLSGRRLDLAHPSPLDIEIEDIAHGLARVARWNGQTSGAHAFSVAQHSLMADDVLVAMAPATEPDLRLAALLHDAPEYVIGDMISPFKALLGDAYRSVEEGLQHAVHMRFSLPPTLPAPWRAAIKQADQICAWYEATRLAGFTDAEAARYFPRPKRFDPTGLSLTPLPPESAQALFLERFTAIEEARKAAMPPC